MEELTPLKDILSKDDALRIVKYLLAREGKKELGEKLYERLLLDEISIEEYFAIAMRDIETPAFKSIVVHVAKVIDRFH